MTNKTIQIKVEDTEGILKKYDDVLCGIHRDKISMVMGGAIAVGRNDIKDNGQKFNCDYRWFGVDGKTYGSDKGDLFDLTLIDIDAKIKQLKRLKAAQKELIDKYGCKGKSSE